MTDSKKHDSFLRHSSWLMIVNVGSGALMWAVHFLVRGIPKEVRAEEYGLFGALLSVLICVPALPLQMVMAHQTAQALALDRRRQLAGMIRWVWLVTTLLWLAGAIAVLVFKDQILGEWKISNPVILLATLAALLFSCWLPLFSGVIQGQQNFIWLGWSNLTNGLGRVITAAVGVLILGAYAAGLMTGVMMGLAVGAGVAIWQSWDLWRAKPLPFDYRGFLKQVIPPMLGFAAFQFMFTTDTIFVKSYFSSEETGYYVAVGTLSRAIIWLVGPLTSVMFPRLVHSAVKAEKNNLMGMVLVGTGVLAAVGALGLWIVGPFVVRFMLAPEYVERASALFPWYAGAMVPLSVANVLLNNLLARSSFRAVPALVILAIGYAFALTRYHDSLIMVLQTINVFSVALLGVCIWFNYAGAKSPPPPPIANAGQSA